MLPPILPFYFADLIGIFAVYPLDVDLQVRLWLVVSENIGQSSGDYAGEKGPDVRDFSIMQAEDLGDHTPRKHILCSERTTLGGRLTRN